MSDTNERSVASTGSTAKFRPIGAYVHTPTYEDLQEEVRRLRITDSEREALHYVVGDVADITGPVEGVLRGLLERHK